MGFGLANVGAGPGAEGGEGRRLALKSGLAVVSGNWVKAFNSRAGTGGGRAETGAEPEGLGSETGAAHAARIAAASATQTRIRPRLIRMASALRQCRDFQGDFEIRRPGTTKHIDRRDPNHRGTGFKAVQQPLNLGHGTA